MEDVITTIIIFVLWFLSILFPLFLTNNTTYLEEKEANSMRKAREGTHFLKQ